MSQEYGEDSTAAESDELGQETGEVPEGSGVGETGPTEVEEPGLGSEGVDVEPSEAVENEEDEDGWAEPTNDAEGGAPDEDSDQMDQGQLQGDRPHFALIGLRSILRMRRVWVAPHGFDSLEPSGDARVFIVHGDDHAGKLTAAVNLCFRLAGERYPQAGIHLYRRRPIEPLTLLEVVESSYWPDGAFVIIRDAFDKSVATGELGGAELDHLTEILRAKESFLLVTTEIDPVWLAALDAKKLAVDRIDLRNVLENHLAYYQIPENGGLSAEVAAEVRQLWETLASVLRTPDLINQLCRRILEEQIRDSAGIAALADEIGKLAIVDLRAWFDKLSLDAQLFAMMAYLFEGLDYDTLERLYLEAVSKLRREGALWMRDLRRLCLLYLQEAMGPDGIGDESIEFADAAIRRQIAWQVGNRRLLLSAVLAPVIADAMRLPIWRDARRRAVLGVALGKLGIHDREMFGDSLGLLAKSRSSLSGDLRNSFAAIPGYAMTEALRRDSAAQGSVVVGTLKRWIKSGHPDFLWTAGAAIWRVYYVAQTLAGRGGSSGTRPELVDQLRQLLKDMVLAYGDLNNDVLQQLRKEAGRAYRSKLYEISREGKKCAAFALERIGRVDVQGMVDLVLDWLANGDKDLGEVALRAARFTLENLARAAKPPSLERNRDILILLQAVIVEAQPVAYVTRAAFGLGKWLRAPGWREALVSALHELADHADRQGRARLREGLSRYWLEGHIPEAREIARSLIARSYAMDGVLTESPTLGSCLLIVDPELIHGPVSRRKHDPEAERQVERRQGSILQILAMIEAQMDVAVLLLGALAATQRTERGLRLTPDLPLHRLMIPGAEKVAPEGAQLVLLLTGGPVVDLEDGLDAMGADHKLVVAAGCDLEVPLGTELLRVGRELSTRDLATVEAKVRLIYLRAQAALDPAGWEPLLKRLGVCIADLDADPEASLTEWARQLGDFAGATGRTDLAKIILCVLFRLAAADLDACLHIVRRWLTEGTDLERPMATAAGFALFRTVSEVPDAWGGLAPQRIFDELAEPLARSGKDGTDTVLRTVERWLAEPDLAEVLADGVEDGRCRLLRWAEEAAPQQAEAFRQAFGRLPRAINKEDLGPTGEALDAVFDRLRVRLAMGRPRPLPNLVDGETYGVIVFDASARGAGSRSSWSPLAAALFSRFNQQSGSLKPLLYRLGERWPAWVAGDPNPIPADLSSGGVRLPRLLGPILAGLSPAAVSFLVVVSDEIWIDGEDWIETLWRERIFTLRQLQGAPYRPVLAAIPHLQGQEKEEVDLMARYLSQPQLGGEEAA